MSENLSDQIRIEPTPTMNERFWSDLGKYMKLRKTPNKSLKELATMPIDELKAIIPKN